MRRTRAPYSLTLLLFAPLALPRAGTASGPPAPGTKTSIVSVGDVRGGDSFSRLEIEMELPDFPAAEVAAARLHVRTAVDDTGRDLVKEDDRKSPLEPLRQGRSAGPRPDLSLRRSNAAPSLGRSCRRRNGRRWRLRSPRPNRRR